MEINYELMEINKGGERWTWAFFFLGFEEGE